MGGFCRIIHQWEKVELLKRSMNGARYFKLIMSMIHLIREQFNAAVVQRIEQETPKL